MRIVVITLFPESFSALTECGITRRALAQSLYDITFLNPRDFTEDAHRTVDDRPYGGGPGMVMMAEPLARAIDTAKAHLGEEARVIYLSPQGQPFQQSTAQALVQQNKLVLLCGRYEGVDQRLLDAYVDQEISVGDFVVSGGELPAMLVLDAVIRLLPGALGDAQSAVQDSFTEPALLDCPHYTRPEIWQEKAVPEVLLSGDHKKIATWRREQAQSATQKKRPDLERVLNYSQS